MKNKLKKTMTALCAALILMGGFSVPAYAQGAATEPPAGDATNDSNVVVEEKEETPPLIIFIGISSIFHTFYISDKCISVLKSNLDFTVCVNISFYAITAIF